MPVPTFAVIVTNRYEVGWGSGDFDYETEVEVFDTVEDRDDFVHSVCSDDTTAQILVGKITDLEKVVIPKTKLKYEKYEPEAEPDGVVI